LNVFYSPRLAKEKEERKKAALERSRQRQAADTTYFQKKQEANSVAAVQTIQRVVEVSSSSGDVENEVG